jgi:hypothetical protein
MQFSFVATVPNTGNLTHFKGLISISNLRFFPALWCQDTNIYLVYPVYACRPTSLAASNTVSVIYGICVFTQHINTVSMDQELMCSIHFQSFLIFLDILKSGGNKTVEYYQCKDNSSNLKMGLVDMSL